MKLPRRRVLFTPGPSTTSDMINRAMLTGDIYPREAEFVSILDEVCRERVHVAATESDSTDSGWVAIPFAGHR